MWLLSDHRLETKFVSDDGEGEEGGGGGGGTDSLVFLRLVQTTL